MPDLLEATRFFFRCCASLWRVRHSASRIPALHPVFTFGLVTTSPQTMKLVRSCKASAVRLPVCKPEISGEATKAIVSTTSTSWGGASSRCSQTRAHGAGTSQWRGSGQCPTTAIGWPEPPMRLRMLQR
ncbi:hypothetical protein ACFPRL_00665 [Pseudoclavibacter helvolus]